MDFDTAPEIKEALSERLARGVFGYGDITDDWFDAYAGWWERRHGFRRGEREQVLKQTLLKDCHIDQVFILLPGNRIIGIPVQLDK